VVAEAQPLGFISRRHRQVLSRQDRILAAIGFLSWLTDARGSRASAFSGILIGTCASGTDASAGAILLDPVDAALTWVPAKVS
jgi:hypothetical protein